MEKQMVRAIQENSSDNAKRQEMKLGLERQTIQFMDGCKCLLMKFVNVHSRLIEAEVIVGCNSNVQYMKASTGSTFSPLRARLLA